MAGTAAGERFWIDPVSLVSAACLCSALRERRKRTQYQHKKALGLSESEVPGYLYRVITHGEVVSNQLKPLSNGRMGFTRVYYSGGRYNTITGIGTNGFITTAFPTRRSDS